jgi:hypothetical protein
MASSDIKFYAAMQAGEAGKGKSNDVRRGQHGRNVADGPAWSAYLSNNTVPSSELPALIAKTRSALDETPRPLKRGMSRQFPCARVNRASI